MDKQIENGTGKKWLTLIIIFLMGLVIAYFVIRIIYFSKEQQVLWLDGPAGLAIYFIYSLGRAIAKSKKYEMEDLPKKGAIKHDN